MVAGLLLDFFEIDALVDRQVLQVPAQAIETHFRRTEPHPIAAAGNSGRRITVSFAVAIARQMLPANSMRSAPSSTSTSTASACVAPEAPRARPCRRSGVSLYGGIGY